MIDHCPPIDPIVGDPCLQSVSWIVAVGIISCFVLAIAMGANDVANSFGTSVGAGVLSLKTACYIASVFEFLGAISLGAGVTDTMRKGIVEIDTFQNDPALLMLGNWCAVVGAGAWVSLATRYSLPVSTTQAVVGGVVGFALVHNGWAGINHMGILFLAASWIVSPVVAGVVSAAIYIAARHQVLRHEVALALDKSRGFISLSFGIVGGLVILFIIVSLHKGNWIWLVSGILISIGVCAATYLLCIFFLIDFVFRTNKFVPTRQDIELGDVSADGAGLEDEKNKSEEEGPQKEIEQPNEVEQPQDPNEVDERIESRFSSAQIVTASFQAFAHGSNDIANVAGPLAGLWVVYQTNSVNSETPIQYWILGLLATGIVIGLWKYGQKVIETIGKNLSKVTPSRGFSIELGTTIAVMSASFVGAPISTTHAKVGGVVGLGILLGQKELKKAVNWKLLTHILISWIVTMPFAGLVSGGLFALFKPFVEAVVIISPDPSDGLARFEL